MNTLNQFVQDLLERHQAPTLLLLGENPGIEHASLLHIQQPEALQQLARQPLALVYGALETLTPEQASELVASLRDVYCQTLYVHVHLPRSPLQHTDFIALGLREMKAFNQVHAGEAVFYFDLYDYKKTPDWLNSQYWANPQFWDKFHW